MKLAASFIALMLSTYCFAETIYVAPVQGTNIPDGQLKTVRELVKMEVQNQSKHQLVQRIDKAQFYIQTKIVKLKSYSVSFVRWQGDKKMAQSQLRAESLSALEQKLGTAVQDVLNSNSTGGAVLFDNKKSLGERAQEKKQRSNFERVQAQRQVMIGFGPAYFGNMNTADTGLGFSAGYVWNIDDHFDLGLQSDFAISTEHSDAFLFGGKIFTNYFFAARDISPFVGAGFGYSWASVNDSGINLNKDSAGGFALGLQAGVKFFRTSTVNFAVSGEYTNIFDRTDLGNPSAFLLKVALFY
ncbi:MAG: outer membrane beta-barrel protein [Pseudomonadota bacterium]